MTDNLLVSMPRDWVERWAKDEPWTEVEVARYSSDYRLAENVVIIACRKALEDYPPVNPETGETWTAKDWNDHGPATLDS